jgi:hypothetical protein
MRSLWRLMALQWLGGEGSEALAGDSVLPDLLPPAEADPVFRVTRDPRPRPPASAAPAAPGAVEREGGDLAVSRRA